MKVKELIEELKKFDGELEVSFPIENSCASLRLKEVVKFIPKEYKFLKEKVFVVLEKW